MSNAFIGTLYITGMCLTALALWASFVDLVTSLYHKMVYRVHLALAGFELTPSVVIGTDCIGSCNSNYYTITTMTDPNKKTPLTTIER
jgi:hypothetical protein